MRKWIRVGNSVRTHPPPPAPVNLEANLYFNVVLRIVSIEAWLTPIHWRRPWFISINSSIFSSFSVMERSSGAGDWIMADNSLLMESTALNTKLMASGCLKVLSETPATKAFVFLPTLVLVISILSGILDLRRVKLPDLNLIMLPVPLEFQIKSSTSICSNPLAFRRYGKYNTPSTGQEPNYPTIGVVLTLF